MLECCYDLSQKRSDVLTTQRVGCEKTESAPTFLVCNLGASPPELMEANSPADWAFNSSLVT